MKRLLLLISTLFIGLIVFAGPAKTIYSIASGDFRNSANIWSLSPGGPPCGCFPDESKDDIFIYHDITISSAIDFGSQSVLEISGATLTVNANLTFSNGSDVTVLSDGALVVNGDVTNLNNSNDITIDGAFVIDGNFQGNNGSLVSGNGYMSTTGATTLVGTGAVFGSTTVNNCVSDCFVSNTVTLPVELMSFEAFKESDEVVLIWITASEINNDYFQIQRSTDGESFEVIGEVDGQGSKNTPTEYKFTDKNPKDGLSFYRLKQTDFNGAFDVTKAISINLEKPSSLEIEVFPNPLNGQNVYLKIPETQGSEFEVFVNDLLGKDYITDLTFINQDGFTLVIIELGSNLPKGVYFVNILSKGSVVSEKLIVK